MTDVTPLAPRALPKIGRTSANQTEARGVPGHRFLLAKPSSGAPQHSWHPRCSSYQSGGMALAVSTSDILNAAGGEEAK